MKKVVFVLVLLFSFITVQAQNFDINLLKSINQNRNKNLDPTFEFISKSVTPINIGAPVLLYGIGYFKQHKATKDKALYLAEATLFAAITTTTIKYAINRERPFDKYPASIDKASDAGSPSFPSGHTSAAFSTATSLSIAYPKWYVIVPAYAWASSVGYSRMHLGVHYPSDVFAGAVIGAGTAYLTHYINKKFVRRSVHTPKVKL